MITCVHKTKFLWCDQFGKQGSRVSLLGSHSKDSSQCPTCTQFTVHAGYFFLQKDIQMTSFLEENFYTPDHGISKQSLARECVNFTIILM